MGRPFAACRVSDSQTGKRDMMHPLVNRTSPKGQAFIGTCAACGQTGLTSATMRGECENMRDMTNESALLEAIEPLLSLTEHLVEALIWCSASQDFQEGGQAREGWLKLCKPLIDAALTAGKSGAET
jgi:hypothetical protein